MKVHDSKSLSTVAKSLILGFFILVSGAAFAQDNIRDASSPVSVEVEKVNINRADAPTIARVLTGVGISRAEAIVSFREEYGDFADVEDLLLVNGVGEVTVRNNEGRINFK